ncbi:hypothetical protein HYALB_00000201 [Hymenoscyphus albidus]|uniref:Mid2 domain-containing protein n=1 Tax=Hymenoscyphus albidus TaxID=595503 RepID=A0A9N9LV34_9HELO|nr:hypothetical protein HYALB_00000201 [Hymenoscyphus albidus]
MYLPYHIFLWMVVSFRLHAQGLPKTYSITSQSEYIVARDCVKGCLWLDESGNSLPGTLGCGIFPIYDECICNANLASSADAYLSSCVLSKCSNSADVKTAISVYSGYCAAAVGPANAAAQTTTLGGGGGVLPTQTNVNVITATATPTSRVTYSSAESTSPIPPLSRSSPSSISPSGTLVNMFTTSWITPSPTNTDASAANGGGDGIPKADKITIGVTVGLGIPSLAIAVVMLILAWKQRQDKKKKTAILT